MIVPSWAAKRCISTSSRGAATRTGAAMPACVSSVANPRRPAARQAERRRAPAPAAAGGGCARRTAPAACRRSPRRRARRNAAMARAPAGDSASVSGRISTLSRSPGSIAADTKCGCQPELRQARHVAAHRDAERVVLVLRSEPRSIHASPFGCWSSIHCVRKLAGEYRIATGSTCGVAANSNGAMRCSSANSGAYTSPRSPSVPSVPTMLSLSSHRIRPRVPRSKLAPDGVDVLRRARRTTWSAGSDAG